MPDDLIDRDLGWNAMFQKITEGGEAYVKVGIQQDTKREQEDGEAPIDMVQLAAIHEFGAPGANIPERSFVRAWHDSAKSQIAKLMARLVMQYLDGKISMRQLLAKLGAWGQGRMRKFLRDLQEPPLKASTIAGKGSANPLVDTGQLLNSIHSVSVHRDVEVGRTQ